MGKLIGFIIVLILSFFVLDAVAAHAQTADEPICPDILPCNADGSVFAPFNQAGPCQPVFARICKQAFCASADQTIKSCQNQNSSLLAEVKRLQRENSLLKKKFRAAQKTKR